MGLTLAMFELYLTLHLERCSSELGLNQECFALWLLPRNNFGDIMVIKIVCGVQRAVGPNFNGHTSI